MAQVRDFRNMPSGPVEDAPFVEVKVGDRVGFKSDFEQHGTIIEILPKRGRWQRGQELRLRNENGFGGEYLRYAKETIVYDEDCWLE